MEGLIFSENTVKALCNNEIDKNEILDMMYTDISQNNETFKDYYDNQFYNDYCEYSDKQSRTDNISFSELCSIVENTKPFKPYVQLLEYYECFGGYSELINEIKDKIALYDNIIKNCKNFVNTVTTNFNKLPYEFRMNFLIMDLINTGNIERCKIQDEGTFDEIFSIYNIKEFLKSASCDFMDFSHLEHYVNPNILNIIEDVNLDTIKRTFLSLHLQYAYFIVRSDEFGEKILKECVSYTLSKQPYLNKNYFNKKLKYEKK